MAMPWATSWMLPQIDKGGSNRTEQKQKGWKRESEGARGDSRLRRDFETKRNEFYNEIRAG